MRSPRPIPASSATARPAPGTGIHLASELFKLTAGVDIVHVPYRGNAGVMPDLLAGRIQMLIDGVPPQVKNIEGGLVRALGVLSKTRTPALPNVPTMIEQGLDYEVPYWTAVYAPAATPKPIVEKLSAEIAKAMKDADVDRQADRTPAPRRSARRPPRWTRSTASSSSSIARSCRTRT